MSLDTRCGRCGCQLKVMLVRVPIMNPTPTTWPDEIPNSSNPIAYEEHEEVSDCPRCTGSY